MLPLRSVGRSNFVMVCVNKFNNVDSKATYYENCCVIYIYIYKKGSNRTNRKVTLLGLELGQIEYCASAYIYICICVYN